MRVCNYIIVLNFIMNVECDFSIPNITLEVLKYGGFRVYVPDVLGISWFTFHANINEDITESDPGKIIGDTKSPVGSYWIINFTNVLKLNDVVNYWVFISVNKSGYRKDDCTWLVTELKDFYTSLNANCTKAQTIINGNKTMCVGDSIILDHFNGPTVDTNLWIVEHRIPTYSEPTYEFNSYENRNDTCFFKNGKLYLKPIALMKDEDVRGILDLREGCTSTNPIHCYYVHVSSFLLPPVKSAKITSRVSFKYGRIEIKAKLSAGDWIVSVIKLDPKDEALKSSTIWMVYSRGNRQLIATTENDIGTCVLYSGEKQIIRRAKQPYSDDFHTYSLEWLPNKLVFYFDFEVYGILNGNYDNAEYVLSLGVAVGGIYDFPDDMCSGNNSKPWKNDDRNYIKRFFQARNDWLKTWNSDGPALKIDYVKVLAL